jgi:hypothetical protein
MGLLSKLPMAVSIFSLRLTFACLATTGSHSAAGQRVFEREATKSRPDD